MVGEAIIDEYQYREAIGKSAKEPTLVVKDLSTEKFAGGIVAVANHVADFTNAVSMVTMLGDTNSHELFIRQKLHRRVDPHFLYRKCSPTIVKRRFVDSYFFTKLFEDLRNQRRHSRQGRSSETVRRPVWAGRRVLTW